MESAATPTEVPVIDFAGVDPASPGGERWEAVRSQVMAALESYTCFEAVFDKLSPEVTDALFEKGMADLFGVPLELKKKNKLNNSKLSDLPSQGYIGGIPQLDYESLIIEDSISPDAVRRFADILWPGVRNPSFWSKRRITKDRRLLTEKDRISAKTISFSTEVQKTCG